MLRHAMESINYVGKLDDYVQKSGCELKYDDVGSDGPAHIKTGFIGVKEYPEGEGRTTKEAKQRAAKASSLLQESSDWDSKASGKSAKSEKDGTKILPAEVPIATTSRFSKDYDHIEPIGDGGFGQVYKARLKHLDMYFAVKIVPNKGKALREALVLAELQHLNIVRYYTSWIEDSDHKPPNSEGSSTSQSSSDASGTFLCIQMELCVMKDLEMWIEEKNLLVQDIYQRKESLCIMNKIIRGVKYIHSKNLMHRDLKPSNIMVGLKGEVKIVDFGLVTTEMDEEGNVMEKTMDTGTRSFMPPEQGNQSLYSNKVDIFALGLVYFKMLWNISSHEMSMIWDDIRNQQFPADFTQSFPEEKDLIESMLHKRPQSRPSAKKLRYKLKGLDLSTGGPRTTGPKWMDEVKETPTSQLCRLLSHAAVWIHSIQCLAQREY